MDIKKIFGQMLRVGFGCVRVLATLGLAASLTGYIAFYLYTDVTLNDCWEEASDIVSESTVEDFESNKTTYFYTDNGQVLAKLSKDKSNNYLQYNELPPDVVNAFVAVEDRSFWTNPGVDLKGIARAILVAVKNKGATQGASTITQQFARSLYLTNERSVLRKVREIMIALQLTELYSKEEIMAAYVNGCCFANNIYGIQDAAKAYLGKSASECSLAETAYLCSIPNRPEYFNPWRDPTAALERKNKILRDMLELGYISQSDYTAAVDEEINVIPKKQIDQYNYATTYAIKCATETIMKYNGFKLQYSFKTNSEYRDYREKYELEYARANEQLYTGGYVVKTTMNRKRQEALQEILNSTLKATSKKRTEDRLFVLQGAATVIDNETGKVTAIIGGRTQTATQGIYAFNRAFQSTRQPGSSIKPLLVYTPALMAGYTDNSVLKNVDVEAAYKNAGHVQELDGDEVRLRDAVRRSLNGCALYLYDDLGPKRSLKYLSSMEFANIIPGDGNLSSALGGFTYGTNTTEMANAYSTLANGGDFQKADCITSIISDDGEELYEQPKPRRIYDLDAVELMTDILKGVLEEGGTAANMHWYDYTTEEAAGKTGTTNQSTDGWFCGFTKDYSISVWIGNDDNTPVDGLYGGTVPAEIWRDMMLKMLELKTRQDAKRHFEDDDIEKTIEDPNQNELGGSAKEKKKSKEHKKQKEYAEEKDNGDGVKTKKMYAIVDANVRVEPNADSEIYTSVEKGAAIEVLEFGEYWSSVKLDGGIYYIYSPLLTN